jgi:hypothetical protein
MRKKLALAGLGLGIAATLLPVTSASAYCSDTYRDLTGECGPCPAIGRAYDNVNGRTGGVLPDRIPADCVL